MRWAHREAIIRGGGENRLMVPSEVLAEETPSGVRHAAVSEARSTEWHYFHMPNVSQSNAVFRVEGTLEDAMRVKQDRISWRVPLDDETTVSFSIDLTHVTGEEGEAYRARRRASEALAGQFQPPEMGNAILAGKVQERDLDRRLSTATMFSVEDYLAQVGQHHPDHSLDRLGRMDTGVHLLRKVWERELRALHEGRPLTQWASPGAAIEMTAQMAGAR